MAFELIKAWEYHSIKFSRGQGSMLIFHKIEWSTEMNTHLTTMASLDWTMGEIDEKVPTMNFSESSILCFQNLRIMINHTVISMTIKIFTTIVKGSATLPIVPNYWQVIVMTSLQNSKVIWKLWTNLNMTMHNYKRSADKFRGKYLYWSGSSFNAWIYALKMASRSSLSGYPSINCS